MTKDISILEWELLSFFESEHVSRDYANDWWEADSVYMVERGVLKLSCSIFPMHRDVRLILKCGEDIVFEWNVLSLADICYIEEKNRTILKFISTESDYTTLQVKPGILIERHSGENDSDCSE